jgi:hypothetical protein
MRQCVLLAWAVLSIAACNADNATGPEIGTVAGTITSSLGGALANVRVAVYESSSDSVILHTNSSGAWSVGNVPLGTGVVQVESLPANCDAQPPVDYDLESPGTTYTVNLTVTCKASGQAVSADPDNRAFDNVRRRVGLTRA